MAGPIPPHVEKFLAENVRSLEQLEILLLLHREPEREWTAADVARELRIDPASAARRLEDLRARGFAADGGGADPRFRAAGAGPVVGVVRELGECYERLRVSVIQVIYSRPAENIQLFADAFRLRKDDEGEK